MESGRRSTGTVADHLADFSHQSDKDQNGTWGSSGSKKNQTGKIKNQAIHNLYPLFMAHGNGQSRNRWRFIAGKVIENHRNTWGDVPMPKFVQDSSLVYEWEHLLHVAEYGFDSKGHQTLL